jgi:hypothetical protein
MLFRNSAILLEFLKAISAGKIYALEYIPSLEGRI